MKIFAHACAIALLFAATQAHGALLTKDYQTAGDGLLTYDTDTGLEWLDVTASQGYSANSALATYAGFDLATVGQVQTLLAHFGFNHINTSFDPTTYSDDFAPGALFDQMMGHTITYPFPVVQTLAHVKSSDAGFYDLWYFEIRYPGVTGVGTSNYFSGTHNAYSTSISTEANFLVRSATAPVPEPATWAMMIAGFGLIGAGMRRRAPAFAG